MGNVSLKVLENSLKFLFKKAYEPCIYFINESIILKIMIAFCVVCIIKTIVLLFKDGSNILHEILT